MTLSLLGVVDSVGAQSLDEALVSTYLTNPELAAQRNVLRATDELVPQALSGWRPTIATDTLFEARDVENSAVSGSVGTIRNSLIIDQNLYQGGETVANTRRSERLVLLERARLVAIEQDVLLSSVEAYSDLLTNIEVLELAIQNENRLRRQLQATEDRFSVGEVTRTDVAQAEARLSEAIADRVRAEGAVLTSKATYRAVINQQPERLIQPQPLADLAATEAEAQQLAEVFNPNIAAARFNLAAAREDVRVAEAALFPELSVRGELTYTEDPGLVLDWEREASIGANISVPLYQGGGEYARIRQTKQIVRQRMDDLEGAYRAVREEVTGAWQALATARSNIASISDAVRANEIALDGSRQEALVGQRTTLDVLDQERDLFASQVDLVAAKRDEIVASYRVKASVGELTVTGIDLPVEPYNPEVYYDNVRNRWFGLGDDPNDQRAE